MANTPFPSFTLETNPTLAQFVVGYNTNAAGGERRTAWSSVLTLFGANLDTLTGLATTGLVKRSGLNTLTIAVSGTDYAPATSGSAILKGNGFGGFTAAVSGTDYAPATSGAALLYGNGAGGFSSATIGIGLTFSAGTLSRDALTGDVSSTGDTVTVLKINGVALSGLATGILKNTTTTGVPSIAVAGDFPTLNQNTTGSAATLTTPRAIYGNNFDGSAALTQVIASTYGGTGNGFTKFSGPTTAEKTFTLPDASATILTTNATVTAGQGGTGQSTYTIGDLLYASGTTALSKLAAVAAGQVLVSAGTGTAPAWSATPVLSGVALANAGTGAFNVTLGISTTLTVGRTLTFAPGDANRTITLSGNPTLADWFDQSVKTTASPSFSAVTATTFTGALSGNATSATNATNTAITDDTTTNATMYPTWVTANTGNLPQKTTSTKLTFNPSTGALAATSFVGNTAASTITGTTLASNVVTSSLTTVGALTSGSIGSGFGSINVGSNSITGGAGSFTTLSTTSDITVSGGGSHGIIIGPSTAGKFLWLRSGNTTGGISFRDSASTEIGLYNQPTQSWVFAPTGSTVATISSTGLAVTGGVIIGSATGGTIANSLNVAGDVYKNNSAYTNPDYVLEKWSTGKIVKFADKPGASDYAGLRPLAEVEAFARKNWHLPRFGQQAGHGMFSGADALLASTEELYLYLFQQDAEIKSLRARVAQLEAA